MAILYDGRLTIEVVGEPMTVWSGVQSKYRDDGVPSVASLVWLSAPSTNTGDVLIGNQYVDATAASRTGLAIVKGTAQKLVNVDLRDVWADVTTAGDELEILYMVGPEPVAATVSI